MNRKKLQDKQAELQAELDEIGKLIESLNDQDGWWLGHIRYVTDELRVIEVRDGIVKKAIDFDTGTIGNNNRATDSLEFQDSHLDTYELITKLSREDCLKEKKK